MRYDVFKRHYVQKGDELYVKLIATYDGSLEDVMAKYEPLFSTEKSLNFESPSSRALKKVMDAPCAILDCGEFRVYRINELPLRYTKAFVRNILDQGGRALVVLRTDLDMSESALKKALDALVDDFLEKTGMQEQISQESSVEILFQSIDSYIF